jgi:hypothetical protein
MTAVPPPSHTSRRFLSGREAWTGATKVLTPCSTGRHSDGVQQGISAAAHGGRRGRCTMLPRHRCRIRTPAKRQAGRVRRPSSGRHGAAAEWRLVLVRNGADVRCGCCATYVDGAEPCSDAHTRDEVSTSPEISKSVFEKFLDLGRRVCVTMNVDAIRVAGCLAYQTVTRRSDSRPRQSAGPGPHSAACG